MSLQQELELETTTRRKLEIEIKPSRRIVVAKSGSRVHLELYIDSFYKLRPKLIVEGLNVGIATYTLAPDEEETPFISRLELMISPKAIGIHPFKVIALDALNRGYGVENLVLVVLPQELPLEIIEHLRTILRMYRHYGIQYVVWYLLMHFYRDKGMSFKEIKALYEFLRGRHLSNGTIGDLINRMVKKGIIVKKGDRYFAGVKDEKLVLKSIDAKRVRAGRKGAKQLLKLLSEGMLTHGRNREEDIVPMVLKKVLHEVEKLVKQGRINKAMGLIQHTLVGVRKTGRWILWIKDIFVYYEKKTRPRFHYFCSEKLAKILQNMGLKQGFVHVEQVNDLIHKLFPQGYREARRVHYLLKSIGWTSYGPPLILYIAIYQDGTRGFKLETIYGEMIVTVNYDPQKANKVIKHLVMPEEHVDEYNDLTYFSYR